MHPALRARIERSLSGGRERTAGAGARRASMVLRALVLLLVVSAAVWFVDLRRQQRSDFDAEKAALLAQVTAKSAKLEPADLDQLARIEDWVTRLAGPIDDPVIAKELEAPGAFERRLRAPIVYVRGAIGAFANPTTLLAASATSRKDAFLLCLLHPPEKRSERLLLRRVRSAYSGDATLRDHTANVFRLHSLKLGVMFLTPPWTTRVQEAASREEVARLSREFSKAPVDAALSALHAGLLLTAFDEPGEPGGVTELDGERPHPVRIALVDLKQKKLLFKLRKSVDPSWISTARRAEYASGLDGCALALDVRETLLKKPEAPEADAGK